ncbi:MAG: PaaI family thioesterase [Actinomycetia bacterium]|nr:PaaI family thioesterase [Actinomycetes bacterium]
MLRRVKAAQNISRMCVACGTENTAGLHAQFLEVEGDEVVAIFTPRPEHQGYPGRLHGGVASTILDETIGRAVSIAEPDTWGVTIELELTFRKPVPLDAPVRVIGRITRDRGRVFEGSGEIVLDDGSVAVQATGKYIRMNITDIAEGDFGEEWFADTRPVPEDIDL